ncbi:MAG: hypothetical protein ABIA37_01765, partial [Candidatus Woesearchaeota archaeon]
VQFGSEYQEAEFVSGNGVSALYQYNFVMDGQEGMYQVKVIASDGKQQVEDFRSLEISAESDTPTGFFAAVGTDGSSGFLNRLFGWVKGWFS